ncbi:hypothetical protein C8R44DRAFT_792973 [Mycena epipterygia]|nr:hypothetical protein C8R44DRAFT_792973 [Mycena epipterygia]
MVRSDAGERLCRLESLTVSSSAAWTNPSSIGRPPTSYSRLSSVYATSPLVLPSCANRIDLAWSSGISEGA